MIVDIEAGYIGIKELAARLAISTRSIWRIIERGELSATRIGRRTLVAKSEVAHWLAGRQVETPTPGGNTTNIHHQFAVR